MISAKLLPVFIEVNDRRQMTVRKINQFPGNLLLPCVVFSSYYLTTDRCWKSSEPVMILAVWLEQTDHSFKIPLLSINKVSDTFMTSSIKPCFYEKKSDFHELKSLINILKLAFFKTDLQTFLSHTKKTSLNFILLKHIT